MIASKNYVDKSPSNGMYEQSPSLESNGRAITYWKLHLHEKTGKSEDVARLTKLKRDLEIEGDGNKDKDYIKVQFANTWKQLRKVQKV